MAPFFTVDIIRTFLSQLPRLPDLRIETNEYEDGALEESLPQIIEEASDICRGLIGDSYLEGAMIDKAFSGDAKYDAAVLFEEGDPKPVAFIVVEKGECKKLKNVWSVNLICAKEESAKKKKGLGQILMGLYLYTIAVNDVVAEKDKYGILELANAYVNGSGLASYSKLGFVFDPLLWGENCFGDYGNLPMKAENINPDKIVAILNGPAPDSSLAKELDVSKPKICKLRGDEQLYLGICKNLSIFLNYLPPANQEDYISDSYELADKRKINYVLLISHLKSKFLEEVPQKPEGRGASRSAAKAPALKDWLESFIRKIEDDPSQISRAPGFSNLHNEHDGDKIITEAPEQPTRTEEQLVKIEEQKENIKSRLRSAFRVPMRTLSRNGSTPRQPGGARRKRRTQKGTRKPKRKSGKKRY